MKKILLSLGVVAFAAGAIFFSVPTQDSAATSQVIINTPRDGAEIKEGVPVLQTRIFHTGNGKVSGSFQIDGDAPADCNTSLAYKLDITRNTKGTVEFTSQNKLPYELQDGDHTIYVCAKDTTGYKTNVVASTFTTKKFRVLSAILQSDETIRFTFSQDININTLKQSSVMIAEKGSIIPGKITKVTHSQFVYTPFFDFDVLYDHMFIVKNTVRNTAGLRLDQDSYANGYQEFEVRLEDILAAAEVEVVVEKTAPTYKWGYQPTSSACTVNTGVEKPKVVYAKRTGNKVAFEFSQAMDAKTVKQNNVFLTGDSQLIPATIEQISEREFVLTANQSLDFADRYGFTVTIFATNAYGACLDQAEDRHGFQEFYYVFENPKAAIKNHFGINKNEKDENVFLYYQ